MNILSKRLSECKDILISAFFILLSFFIKRDERNVAFGSWCGELYNDNSKYLAEYIRRNHPDYHVFWVGKPSLRGVIPPEFTFVELDRFSSGFQLLRCGTFFFTQMHRPDISRYNVYRGATLCLLDHGNTLKKWAMDAAGYHGELEYKNFPPFKKIYTKIVGENYPYRYMTVSSHKTAAAYRSALAYRMGSDSEIIETGLPRNDALLGLDARELREKKEKYAALLGFDPGKKVALYLPTYRRNTEQVESFSHRDPAEAARLDALLKEANAVLLEKNHFAADRFSVNQISDHYESIIKVTKPVDVQEMLQFADILISDYSGCILDFLLLDRPLIYYVYDYEVYRSTDSGLYYDISDYAAGCVAYRFEEVYEELRRLLLDETDTYQDARQRVRGELATFDDGKSSERVFQKIFLKSSESCDIVSNR